MEFEKAKQLFEKYEICLEKEKYEKLSEYENMLLETNKVMNLTALTETKDVWIKHFLDSIILLKKCNIKKNSSFIDVGCGAGFPSIPISIMRNDIKIFCLDSLNKRVGFLGNVINNLSLNAKAFHERAEIGSHSNELREKFDYAAARAVANMPVLSEYCLPYVKVGGKFIAMKGNSEDINLSKNSIQILGGSIEKVINYDIEGNNRVIYEIDKVKKCDSKYPRNTKQIKNKPL